MRQLTLLGMAFVTCADRRAAAAEPAPAATKQTRQRPVERTVTAADRAFWSFQPVPTPTPGRPGRRLATDAGRPLPPRTWKPAASACARRADRRTLLRRVTFDLIGLPPTPEEVDAFLADPSPDAYEKVVDRLLASPALRRAVGPALARRGPLRRDAAAATTNVAYPHAWRYRDYVIARVQRGQALRPVRPRAARRRRAARPRRPADEAEQLIATGFLAPRPEGRCAERRRQDADGPCIDEQIDTRRQGVPGPDRRLRPLPRPQVRPDPARRLLRPGRHLHEHQGDRPRTPTRSGSATASGRRGAGATPPAAMARPRATGQDLPRPLRGSHLTGSGPVVPRLSCRSCAGEPARPARRRRAAGCELARVDRAARTTR